MEHLKSYADNKKARMLFVEYWANYCRTHPDSDWGEQQNILINAMMENAKHYPFSAKKYLEMKGEKSSR